MINSSGEHKCKLISLDTSSSSTGWGVFIDGEYSGSGLINLKKFKGDGQERMNEMCLSIHRLLRRENPDIVVIEETSVTRNAASQRMLTMILGFVYAWCLLNNTYFEMMKPSVWRSLISSEKKGRKRAELKQWSVQKVSELYGEDVTDDQSDAILIGQAYVKKYRDRKDYYYE